jgi:HEAT repeat protein
MGDATRVHRIGRRIFALTAGVAALSAVLPREAFALDVSTALHDLAESPDYRVRVTAALFLGRARAPGGRAALEQALSDSNPAVRAAAATALGVLGDPVAITAIARALTSETSANVRAQLQATLGILRNAVSSSPTPSSSDPRQIAPNVRIVVKLGAMRNGTPVRGDELRRVLHDAARSRARGLRDVAIVDTDTTLLQVALARHIPVITLDGSVTQLTESSEAGNLQVRASVTFAMKREQTLKGMLTGAATTFGSSQQLSDEGRRKLQNDAVDGAVQSALRGADQGLTSAAL